MRLEVERPELIDADDPIWVDRLGIDGAVHQAGQVQDPVLLGLEVWIAGLLQVLDYLKGHALLAEQHPQAFVADVVDHPLSDQELGQLREDQVENGRSWSTGRDTASWVIARRWPG